jgi:hypothetical protein
MAPLFGFTISVWTLGGLAVGVLSVLALPVLAIVVGVMLYRRAKGQQPGTVITIPGLHKQVDLGIFSGLVAAARSGDRTAVLREVQLLGIRAGDAGGLEALIEKFIYDQLELKLKTPGARTDALNGIADLLGVSPRQLLDLVEGKAADVRADGQTAPASVPVKAVAAPVIAILLCLACAGGAWAAPPLTSPQRFYPAEAEPVVDPPTFYRPAPGALAPIAGQPLVPSGWQDGYAAHNQVARTWSGYSNTRRRWFRCW